MNPNTAPKKAETRIDRTKTKAKRLFLNFGSVFSLWEETACSVLFSKELLLDISIFFYFHHAGCAFGFSSNRLGEFIQRGELLQEQPPALSKKIRTIFLHSTTVVIAIYSIDIADTGQLSITSWQLQSPHSSAITLDFPFSILKTFAQRDSHVPHPMQISSFTFGFGILL